MDVKLHILPGQAKPIFGIQYIMSLLKRNKEKQYKHKVEVEKNLRIEEKGIKRHILVDGRGVPLSVVVTGANRHDVSQLENILANKVMAPIMERQPEKLCADVGYTGETPRAI